MKTLLLFLLAIPSCFHRETLPSKYHIILCVGQSNCMGMATLEAQDSVSGAWLWTESNSWTPAIGALNKFSTIDDNNWGRLSMINSFGKKAAQHSRPYEIGLVVNARASTSIQDWTTGHNYMLISIQRAKEALTANPGSEITAVFWHQGESNSHNPETYRSNFLEIRHEVDSLLGTDMPIVIGGLSHFLMYAAINDTIQSVATSIHDCYYVSSDSLTTYDGTHLDSPSQRIFGLRYWSVYSQLP